MTDDPAAMAPQPGRDGPGTRAMGRSGSAGPDRSAYRREFALSTMDSRFSATDLERREPPCHRP
jgi:hypothetical protein